MITLWRIFIASWKHVARNAWLGMATVFVFMMALLSVNVLLGVQAMLGRAVQLLEDKVDVTITFKAGVPEAILTQARFYLTSLPQVRDVRYVTAEEALANFKERHAKDEKVLAALGELSTNPLGAELVVRAHSTEDYPFLLKAVQNPQYAGFIQSQSYDDHQLAIAKIQDISRNSRIVGAALVALFALFGLLIAFNAISVAVYTHREEIAIMRLVGASSFFIRAPFILEGIWLALLALALSSGVVFMAMVWLEPSLMPLFDQTYTGLRAFFTEQGPLILAIQAGTLSGLVVVVSWLAVGRHMKR